MTQFTNVNMYINTAILCAISLIQANREAPDNVRYLRKIADTLKDLETDFIYCDDDLSWKNDPTWTDRIRPRVNKLVRIVNKGIKRGKMNAKPANVRLAMAQLNNTFKPGQFIGYLKDYAYEGEWDMIRMQLDDMADHLELAHWIAAGKFNKAEDKMRYHMDTSSYERVATSVWNYVMERD